jgi:NAD(P)-dependent dehydrogenase (short-subunit alcohol dehydrogenase family)
VKLEAGQVAVVTGSASGLGLALAQECATRRMRLVLADVEADALAAAVATIEATGAEAIGVRTDVRFSAEVDALAAAALDRFGRVDLVVNNAGVSQMPGRMWEFEENDWEWAIAVNLWGVIHGIRAFVPRLVAQGTGHLVNTASMAGVSVGPGLGPYVASKHAVVALTEALAAELALAAPGVGVTVVCPGQVTTNIFNAERNRPAELSVTPHEMTEADLAGTVEWMAGVSGDNITPAEAAAIVVAGIEADRLHVAPNGSAVGVKAWVERLLADFPDA